ncbi:hypothetical protein Q9233_013882 [Columba guinea]|nr:hypothetical protein Q9233_013882 [Columba guinea]
MGNAGSVDSQQTEFRAHSVPLKLPMPEPGELEERFAVVLELCGLFSKVVMHICAGVLAAFIFREVSDEVVCPLQTYIITSLPSLLALLFEVRGAQIAGDDGKCSRSRFCSEVLHRTNMFLQPVMVPST